MKPRLQDRSLSIIGNNVLRYRFQHYQQHALGKNSKTIDELLSALTEFEIFTNCEPFVRLNTDDIVAFKEHLASRNSKTSQNRLSATTVVHKLRHLTTFFTWLKDQSEGRALKQSVVDCFNPDLRTRAAARTSTPRVWAKLKVWNDVLLQMPADSLSRRRDRAVVALLILTGVRDAALVSLCLKHVHLVEQRLVQDGTEVNTKFGKTISTAFFPVGDVPREVIRNWHDELVELGAGPEDPVFPTDVSDLAFLRKKRGELLEHWTNAGPVRRIIRSAFELAGRPSVVPHSIRNTLTHEGIERNLTIEELVAWGQNLGHNSVHTTIGHYGRMTNDEIGAVMRKLVEGGKYGIREELISEIYDLSPEKLVAVLQLVKTFSR